MLNLGNLVVTFTADITRYMRSVNQVTRSFDMLSLRSAAVGAALTAGVTAPLLGMGTAAVKEFARFDAAIQDSMAIMEGVTPIVRKQVEAMSKSLSELRPYSADKVAKAFLYLGSAGYTAQESMKLVPAVVEFATAGMFDLEQATSLVIDSQSALGLRSKDTAQNLKNLTDLTDVLVKGNKLANVSVEDLSIAMTNKGATALRLVNKDMYEGVAILAAYGEKGIKAQRAGEALNIMLRDFQSAIRKAPEAWEAMGISTYDAGGKMLKVSDIIRQLDGVLAGATDEQKALTLAELKFQDRSVIYVKSLLGMSDAIDEYESKLRQAAGTTTDVAAERMKAFSKQVLITWNAIKNLGIEVGEIMVPYVQKGIDKIKEAITWWKELSVETKELIVHYGVLAATIGPAVVALSTMSIAIRVLLPLVGALSAALSSGLIPVILKLGTGLARVALLAVDPFVAVANLSALFTSFAGLISGVVMTALGGLTAVLTTLAGILSAPLTLAIVGVTAAFAALYAIFPSIREGLKSIWDWLGNVAGGIKDRLGGAIDYVKEKSGFSMPKGTMISSVSYPNDPASVQHPETQAVNNVNKSVKKMHDSWPDFDTQWKKFGDGAEVAAEDVSTLEDTLEGLDGGVQEATKAATANIRELQFELKGLFDPVNKAAYEIENKLAEMGEQGAPQELIDRTRELLYLRKQITEETEAATEAIQSDLSTADQLMADSMTLAEQAAQQRAELQRLFSEGFIDQRALDHGMGEITKQLNGEDDKPKKKTEANYTPDLVDSFQKQVLQLQAPRQVHTVEEKQEKHLQKISVIAVRQQSIMERTNQILAERLNGRDL